MPPNNKRQRSGNTLEHMPNKLQKTNTVKGEGNAFLMQLEEIIGAVLIQPATSIPFYNGKRSRTAYSYFQKTEKNGPHTFAHVGIQVILGHLNNDSSPLLLNEKHKSRIFLSIGQIRRIFLDSITPQFVQKEGVDESKNILNNYLKIYTKHRKNLSSNKANRKKRLNSLRKILEMHIRGSYTWYRDSGYTKDEIKGKGERRDKAHWDLSVLLTLKKNKVNITSNNSEAIFSKLLATDGDKSEILEPDKKIENFRKNLKLITQYATLLLPNLSIFKQKNSGSAMPNGGINETEEFDDDRASIFSCDSVSSATSRDLDRELYELHESTIHNGFRNGSIASRNPFSASQNSRTAANSPFNASQSDDQILRELLPDAPTHNLINTNSIMERSEIEVASSSEAVMLLV